TGCLDEPALATRSFDVVDDSGLNRVRVTIAAEDRGVLDAHDPRSFRITPVFDAALAPPALALRVDDGARLGTTPRAGNARPPTPVGLDYQVLTRQPSVVGFTVTVIGPGTTLKEPIGDEDIRYYHLPSSVYHGVTLQGEWVTAYYEHHVNQWQ